MSYKKPAFIALTALVAIGLLSLIFKGSSDSENVSQIETDTLDQKQEQTTEREFLYIYGTRGNPSSVLVQVDSLSTVELLETHTDWLKVSAKIGLPAWIKTENLSFSTSEKQATLTADSTIRSIPMAEATTIAGKLAKGLTSKVIDQRDDGWTQILTPKNFPAWISKQELSVFTPKSGMNKQAFLKSASSNKVKQQTITKPKPKQKPKPSTKAEVAIKTLKSPTSSPIELSVYNSTKQSKQIIATLNSASELIASPITRTVGNIKWQKVFSKTGFPAWISSKNLTIKGEKATTSSRANIRTEPRIHSDTLITTLNPNERFKITGRKGKWVKVIAPSHLTAWVDSKQLEKLTAQQ